MQSWTRMAGSRRPVTAGLAVVTAYVVAIVAAVATGLIFGDQHPLVVIAAADVVGTLVIFLFSVGFSNSSFYDPYWSVAPMVIGAYWVSTTGGSSAPSVRQLVVLALIALWGVRLTYNWWRQWKGLDHEDWRYRDLRRKSGGAYWLVSLTGIHLFPTVLVYAGCLSLWPVFAASAPRPIGPLDGLALAIGLFSVWLETRADRQLHEFVRSKPDPHAILDTGVWAWCRNPNYLGEIGFWLALALFGTSAHPSAVWIWVGPGLMLVLFVGISIPLKEKRMLAHRPGFAAHRRRVPKLLPLGTRPRRA